MFSRSLVPFLAACAASATLAVPGCGGKAVLDGPAGQGGGAGQGAGGTTTTTTWTTTSTTTWTTTSTTTWTTTGTTTGTTTSTTTGTGGSLPCPAACNALSGCLDGPVGCVPGCFGTEPMCAGPFQQFLECFIAHAGSSCDWAAACHFPLQAWLDCQGGCSGIGGCSVGSDGSCACTGTLGCSPPVAYEAECKPTADGSASCACFVGGALRGTCAELGGSSCSLTDSCCAALFFVPGG